VQFRCLAFRFNFRVLDGIFFPPGAAANTFRGAFGHIFRRIACIPACHSPRNCAIRNQCAYAWLFEPACLDGPSGLRDAPRPFVIRAADLDGRRYAPEEQFSIDVHVFELRKPVLVYFILAFSELAESGLGRGRSRVHLESVQEVGADRKPGRSLFDLAKFALVGQPKSIDLNLEPPLQAMHRAHVWFRTPTELRGVGETVSVEDFGALFARIRDRVSTLRSLYGEGPLEIDFRGMAERARAVRAVRSHVRIESARRRSSRTGRAHPLSGFTGDVDYEGELTEFVPFLEAAYWTGVGKHTVWGNGTIESLVC
jgi:hypothetical protein